MSYDPAYDGIGRSGALLLFVVFGVVALMCWLVVDVMQMDMSVSKSQPQIIVNRQGQYECIKLINERASTCRKVQE